MNTLKDYVNWKLTHADKVAEADGYPLVMENCKANKQMKQLEIYGNSFQDGTPTPENPVEVQSVGELVSDVNDTNYGKYKIPLLINGEGETATYNIFLDEPLRKIGDSADYIDFKENKVVRRVKAKIISSSGVNAKNTYYFNKGWNAYSHPLKENPPYTQSNYPKEKCTHFLTPITFNSNDTVEKSFIINADQQIAYFITGKASNETVADFKTFLKTQQDNGNPVTLYYRLATPGEETINLDLPKLKSKTTIIEVDTSLAPSSSYGKYIKK